MVENLKEYFTQVIFEQKTRSHNRSMDVMATIGSLLCIAPEERKMSFCLEHLQVPAYDIPESCLACEVVSPLSPWYDSIFQYLQDGTLLPDITHF